ncbi:MAG: peptidogalycan biosysnthesis protein, partial [Caulobacter sp.]
MTAGPMGVQSAVRVHRAISEIGQDAWDACAASTGDPFVSYDFLSILEESGCVAARTGWAPQHLTVLDEADQVAGVMPLYLKSHSQGEYVFDHSWADAYERAGGRYYPKLQCSSPFSPVTGSRLIVRPDIDADEGRSALLGGALTLCERMGASSLHVTFPVEDQWRWMGERGMLLRQDQQYHWENRGYETFDDFLGALSANRRKTIRRERRDAQQGLEIVALTGADLTEDHWDAFFAFYMDTGGRKW